MKTTFDKSESLSGGKSDRVVELEKDNCNKPVDRDTSGSGNVDREDPCGPVWGDDLPAWMRRV
jgi:hypothetical protein